MLKDKIVVGKIIKPQGVKGQLKVAPITQDEDRFYDLEYVYIDGVKRDITDVSINTHGIFITIDGVNDRTVAESYRNKLLEIDRKDAIELDEGEYFVADILGATVIIDDEKIGVLKDIQSFGSADIYEIKLTNGKVALMPALAQNIILIDPDKAIIVIDKTGYEQTVVIN